ncbi:MAG: iron-containing alcohol dehydrogenase [Fusobacteriaceae bacterium]
MKKFILTEVFMENSIWSDLIREIKNYNNILVIHGIESLFYIKNDLFKILEKKQFQLINYENECSYFNINSILKTCEMTSYDLIIGIGGGKSIDLSKIIMDKLNIPLFTIPTIASTCACISNISVVYKENHNFEEIYNLKNPPHKTFINLNTLISAPKKYLLAGIGDTLAKYYEMRLKTKEKKLNFLTLMGSKLSVLCKESMLNFGNKALITSVIDKEFTEVIGVILVTTGIISNLIDFKYNGALAHDIFDALTKIKGVNKKFLHGEVVAFGILVQLKLENKLEEFNELLEFYKKVKFPILLKEIVGKDEYMEKRKEVLNKIIQLSTKSEIPFIFNKDIFIKIFEEGIEEDK